MEITEENELEKIRNVLKPRKSYQQARANQMPLRLVLELGENGADGRWETVHISKTEYDALNLLHLLWTPGTDNLGLCYSAVPEEIRTKPTKNLGYRFRASLPIARLLYRLRTDDDKTI